MLRNRKKFTSTLKNEYHKKLNELNTNTKIPKSKLLDEAVELLLEKRSDQLED